MATSYLIKLIYNNLFNHFILINIHGVSNFFATSNNITIIIFLHIYLCVCVFIFISYIPAGRNFLYQSNSMFVLDFTKIAKFTPKILYQYAFLPTLVCEYPEQKWILQIFLIFANIMDFILICFSC